MRDLFGNSTAVFGEILSQAQDDEPSVGIFRDDRAAFASTLNSHYYDIEDIKEKVRDE